MQRRIALLGALVCALAVVGAVPSAASAQLVISELRLHGPGGASDEYIEIYNNSGLDHQVAGGGTGYAVVASDGTLRCTIPNFTTIPNRGHYLCVNSDGYSLLSYPAGEGVNATGDTTYTAAIPINRGVALFNTTSPAGYGLAGRMDAVGPSTEPDTLYREGTGYTPLLAVATDFALTRRPPTAGFLPQDTNNNANDFRVVAVDSNASVPHAVLGAPGPENLSSPIPGTSSFPSDSATICPGVTRNDPPNRVRTGSGNSGTLTIRRKITNATGGNTTRLRYRLVNLTTAPALDAAHSDLRLASGTIGSVTDPCTGDPLAVEGLLLETPPAQALGGGFNSSVSASLVTSASPFANFTSKYVEFKFNVARAADFYGFCAVGESLPGGGGVIGETGSLAPDGAITSQECPGSDPAATNDVPPSVSGTAAVGQTLTGGNGTWTGNDLVFFRQWRRCDGAGANCSDIAGANGQTYTVAEADRSSTIRFRQRAGNSGGTVPADSTPTGVVPQAVAPGPGPGPGPDPDPPPVVPPDNSFTLGRFVAARNGTGTLRLALPGPGRVVIRDAARRDRFKPARKAAAAAGALRVRITPNRAGMKALRKRGRLRVRLNVEFTPTGGQPATRAKTVRLKLRARR